MATKSAQGSTSSSGPIDRMGQLRFSFADLAADAALVSHLPNIRYLCGFSGSAGFLLVEPFGSTLFTDSRYTFQAAEEVSQARVHIAKDGPLAAVSKALRAKRGRRRVAYAQGRITVAQKAALEDGAGRSVRWVSDCDVIEKLRAVKDANELAAVREAGELISDAFRDVLKRIRPSATELELAAEIEYAIKLRGGSGPSFETIVASGDRSAWAHARPTANRLGKSALVVLDQGAIIRGYCSDMTRTVFVGRAPNKVRKLYQAVWEAQQSAKSVIRPGAKAGDVDEAARGTLRHWGLAEYFTHSTGHGLGLEVHEMPRLGKKEKTVLREGMILTVEPGVYLKGLGGIRIEDDVLVTANGFVDLTNAPRDFLEL